MTKTKICTIRLLNKTYEIKCPEHEADNLQLAAQKLNESLLEKKKQFRKLDDFQVLLLAGIHISHELVVCQAQQQHQHQQLSEFISSLENKISRVSEKA